MSSSDYLTYLTLFLSNNQTPKDFQNKSLCVRKDTFEIEKTLSKRFHVPRFLEPYLYLIHNPLFLSTLGSISLVATDYISGAVPSPSRRATYFALMSEWQCVYV